MNHDIHHAWSDHVARLTHGLAIGKNEAAVDCLAETFNIDHVAMFTSGNLEKRFGKLTDQLELLEDVIEGLEDFIVEYVKSVPLAAYDTGGTDGDRFVSWLGQRCELNAEQRDVCNVIRCRIAVEETGRRNRLAHVRFQELRSLTEQLAVELGENETLAIHLNPIRLWSVFESDLFNGDDDETVDEPAELTSGDLAESKEDWSPSDETLVEAPPNERQDVLFYAFDNEVRTAMFDPNAQIALRTVGEIEPCALDELALKVDLACGMDRESLCEIIRDAAETGIVAFS